jgi:signal transduction histidine kinase
VDEGEPVRAGDGSSDAIRRALAQERERIGRDLHDSVVQDLYAVALLLNAALGRIDDPRAAERVRTAISTVDGAISRLRSIVFEVSEPDPSVPLAEQLLRVVAGRHEQLGFTPEVLLPDPQVRLPQAVTAELLQFLSEALANVARHARATHALVRLELGPGGAWALWVQDDGRGFDPGAAQAGLGLLALRRRARLLAARLEVDSSPGRGTTVRISHGGAAQDLGTA